MGEISRKQWEMGTTCGERGGSSGETKSASDETGEPATCKSQKLMEEHLNKEEEGNDVLCC